MHTLNEKTVNDTSSRIAVLGVMLILSLLNTTVLMSLVKGNFLYFLYVIGAELIGIYILYDYRLSAYTSAFIDFAMLNIGLFLVLFISFFLKRNFLDPILDAAFRPFITWTFYATIIRLAWPANQPWPVTGLYSFFHPPAVAASLQNKILVWGVLLALMPIAYLLAQEEPPSVTTVILLFIGLIVLKLNGRKTANAVITVVSENERFAATATEMAAALEKLKADLALRMGNCDIVNITNDPRASLKNILNEDELTLINALERLRPEIRFELILYIKNILRNKNTLKPTPAANDPISDTPSDGDV